MKGPSGFDMTQRTRYGLITLVLGPRRSHIVESAVSRTLLRC